MKKILAATNDSVLARYARSNVLVAFDYDGTLAPIVADRDRAKMRAPTRKLLTAVAARYPTAVLSGRAQRDVSERLADVPVAHVIGNHGMEPGVGMKRFAAIVAEFSLALRESLAELRGVEIEDKTYSLTVHYRKAREKRLTRLAILDAAARLAGPHRLIFGKQIVNILPEGAPHKGTALVALRDRVGADTAIFLGDDVTDEDVFGIDEPGRLLSIRIGAKRTSAALYFLEDQRQIDPFLARLVELRRS